MKNSIRLIETRRFSWKRVYSKLGIFLLYGSACGLIYGLIYCWIHQKTLMGSIGFLFMGLTSSLVIVIVDGFQPVIHEFKKYPNQGAWLTVREALKISLPIAIIIGTSQSILAFSDKFIVGLSFGIIVFLVFGLYQGGLDIIEHAIIRLIIAVRGHAPLNYARFLDYAANELNFLQKVGGGYVFIHRYLLEHFAEIAVERGYVDVNARRHPQSY